MQFNGSVQLLYRVGIYLHRFLVIVFNLKLMYFMFYSHPSLSFFLIFPFLFIDAMDKYMVLHV